MKIIALAGYMKSGKTAAATSICKIDPRFERISFANLLKEEYAAKYDIDRSDLDDVIVKERHRKPMQELGDFNRAKDRYYYASRLIKTLAKGSFYVCDDTRRIEELEVFLKLKAIPLYIYADPYVRRDRGWEHNFEIDNHPSEIELGSLSSYTWHCLGGEYIFNNGTKEELTAKLSDFLRRRCP